jgi:hypothetical protein
MARKSHTPPDRVGINSRVRYVCGLRGFRLRGGGVLLGRGLWRGRGTGKSRFLRIRLRTRATCRAFVAPQILPERRRRAALPDKIGAGGMTTRAYFGGLGSLPLTGLKTGHYLLNEFGARGRQWSVRRWGRLWGVGKWPLGFARRKRVASGE